MASRTLRRKMLINLALTLLVGALVMLVVLEPGHEPPPPAPTITNLQAADIDTVSIEQPDRPTITLQRGAGGWRMTDPRELRASKGKVETLLELASSESHGQFDASGADREQLGLSEPRATLVLGDTRLDFGDTEPIEGRRYVQVGDTVHLVGGRVMARLRNDPMFWVDNRLLPEGARITALELPDARLTRDEQGLWHADPEPEGLSADDPVGLVTAWENASALAVKEASEAPPDDATRVRVTLADRDEPIEFRLVELNTGFALIREDLGLRYTMTGPQRAELLDLTGPATDDTPGNAPDR